MLQQGIELGPKLRGGGEEYEARPEDKEPKPEHNGSDNQRSFKDLP